MKARVTAGVVVLARGIADTPQGAGHCLLQSDLPVQYGAGSYRTDL